jgi:hypothetical protein
MMNMENRKKLFLCAIKCVLALMDFNDFFFLLSKFRGTRLVRFAGDVYFVPLRILKERRRKCVLIISY